MVPKRPPDRSDREINCTYSFLLYQVSNELSQAVNNTYQYKKPAGGWQSSKKEYKRKDLENALSERKVIGRTTKIKYTDEKGVAKTRNPIRSELEKMLDAWERGDLQSEGVEDEKVRWTKHAYARLAHVITDARMRDSLQSLYDSADRLQLDKGVTPYKAALNSFYKLCSDSEFMPKHPNPTHGILGELDPCREW